MLVLSDSEGLPENVFFVKNETQEKLQSSAKKFVIDGSVATTINRFYSHISSVLKFPSYFGRNLDALEECLVDFLTEEPSPKDVFFKNFRSILSEEDIGIQQVFFQILVRAIEDANTENEDNIKNNIFLVL